MNDSFYKHGLRFSCKRCSHCCRHEPGYVFISYNDLDEICKALDLTREKVVKQYCRIIDINGFKKVSLNEKPNCDCIFWDKAGCLVYENRPLQCRSYPFWHSNLYSQDAWQSLMENCPGVGIERLFNKEEIEAFLKKQEEQSYIRITNNKIVL